MKKYSSIKAVRPIVFVAILVLLTILFALYSTSINPIAEDVFTALDLDDTPLADVATDVKQAEALIMSGPNGSNETTAWDMSKLGKVGENSDQGSLGNISHSGTSFLISNKATPSNGYAVASYYMDTNSGNEYANSTSNYVFESRYLGNSHVTQCDCRVVIAYDFLLSPEMYDAIAAGRIQPSVSGTKLQVSEPSNRSGKGDFQFATYIGVGTKASTSDTSFGGYSQLWGYGSAFGTQVDYKRNDKVDVYAPTATLPKPSSVAAHSGKPVVLRVAVYGHLYGNNKKFYQIKEFSMYVNIPELSDTSAPTISLNDNSLIDSLETASKSLKVGVSESESPLKSLTITKVMDENGSCNKSILSETLSSTSSNYHSSTDVLSRTFGESDISLDNGAYKIVATNVKGLSKSKYVYCYNINITLKIECESGAVGQVKIDGNYGTSASKNAINHNTLEFTLWAKVNAGSYFKGFVDDGSFTDLVNFNNLDNDANAKGTYQHINQNSAGAYSLGEYGFKLKINKDTLAKYPSTITIKAKFGAITPTGITDNAKTFTYGDATINGIAPKVGSLTNALNGGLQSEVSISGNYADDKNTAFSGKDIKYAGTYTATIAIKWNNHIVGQKIISDIKVNKAPITVAPVFDGVVSKVYDGNATISTTIPKWTVVVGSNYDTTLSFDSSTVTYKYIKNKDSTETAKDVGTYAILADADATSSCSDATFAIAILASYSITYDRVAYVYVETSSSYVKGDATGRIDRAKLTVSFTIEGEKTYDATVEATKFVTAEITSGTIKGESLGVTFSAQLTSKDANPNGTQVEVAITNFTGATAGNYTYSTSDFSYYKNKQKVNPEQFTLPVKRAPLEIDPVLSTTTKTYDTTNNYTGTITNYTNFTLLGSDVINPADITIMSCKFDKDTVEASKIIIEISYMHGAAANYYWAGYGQEENIKEKGFNLTKEVSATITPKALEITILPQEKFYGTADPDWKSLTIGSTWVKVSDGGYAGDHTARTLGVQLTRDVGTAEAPKNQDAGLYKGAITATATIADLTKNYNLTFIPGDFTINKTIVAYEFDFKYANNGTTVVYGTADDDIITLINAYACRSYDYAVEIEDSYKITSSETNVPKVSLKDATKGNYYSAGTYVYNDTNKGIIVTGATHKNFEFVMAEDGVKSFTIVPKTIRVKVVDQRGTEDHNKDKEYKNAPIAPTSRLNIDVTFIQEDIENLVASEVTKLQNAVKVVYSDDNYNITGPSACGEYKITAVIEEGACKNNFTLQVDNNGGKVVLKITERTITVSVIGFADGDTNTIYKGLDKSLYVLQYKIDNIISGQEDYVLENVNVTFNIPNSQDNRRPWPNAGRYSVSAIPTAPEGDKVLKNYTITQSSVVTITISKAPLTVTYVDETVVYGEAPDALVSYRGFVGEGIYAETEAVLTKQPTVKYHRQAVKIKIDNEDPNKEDSYMPDNANNYDHLNLANGYINANEDDGWQFVASGGEADNYDFIYKPGTLWVTKKELSVTFVNCELTYGDLLVNGIDKEGGARYEFLPENADQHFTLSGLVTEGGFIAALDGEYGKGTYTEDCFGNIFGTSEDDFFIPYVYNTDEPERYQAGDHDITFDYFKFKFKNYNVTEKTYNKGKLTIKKAPISLSIKTPGSEDESSEAEKKPLYYGDVVVKGGSQDSHESDYKFVLDGAGFVYDDTIDVLNNDGSIKVIVREQGGDDDVSTMGKRRYLEAGSYNAIVTAEGEDEVDWSKYLSNYDVTIKEAQFVINPKPLTIAYEDKRVYDDESKRGKVVYNGVPQSPADGEDYQTIWSYLLTVDEKDGFVKGVKVEGSGEYVVPPESFATYEAVFRDITIAFPVDSQHEITGNVNVDSDGKVISYLVKPTLPNVGSIKNYAITFVAGKFTIMPKNLHITIYRQDRIYNSAPQAPTSLKDVDYAFNMSDFCLDKDGDETDALAIQAKLTLNLADGENAVNTSKYQIIAQLESSSTIVYTTNYNLVVNEADSDYYLYINPRTIKVSYKDVNATYGDITKDYDHTQNLVYENIIAGETPVGIGAVLNAPIANDRNYVDAGTYVITPDIANIELLSANYVFSAEQCVEGQLVIARKELNVTVQSIGVEAGCTSTGPNDPNDPCDEIHIEHLANLVTQAQQIAEQKAALEDLPLGMRVFNFIYTASDFVQGEDESVLEAMPFIANIQYLIDTYRTITETKEDVLDLVNKIDGVDILDANYYFNCTDTVIKFVRVKSKYNLTYLQSLKDAGSLITSGSFVYNGNMRTMETSGLVIGDLEDLLAPEKIRENGDGGKLSLRFVYTKTIDANGNAVIGSVPAVSISEVGTYAVTGYFQNHDVTYKNVTITLEATIVITARPVNYVIDSGLLEQIYGETDKHLHGKAEAVEGEEESGLLSGQELGVSITIPTNDNVYRPLGNYAITASYTNTNYAVTFKVRNANGDLINLYDAVEDDVDENQYYVVNPRPIEISLGYQTQVYNGSVAPVIDSASFQDVGAFKILPDESADIVISIAPEDQVALYEVGSYDLVAVANNANYALTVVTYNVIEITAASINVNATIDDQTYDGAVAELEIIGQEVIGLKSGDALGTNVNVTYAVVGEAINVGDYEVTATIDNLNYVIGEFVTNGLTINKLSLAIKLNSQRVVYDGTLKMPSSFNSSEAIVYEIVGDLAANEEIHVQVMLVSGGGVTNVLRQTGGGIGGYAITADYSILNIDTRRDTTANYDVIVYDSTFTINPKDPDLNIKQFSKDYEDYKPFEYSINGTKIVVQGRSASSSDSKGAITYRIPGYTDDIQGSADGFIDGKSHDIVLNAGSYELIVQIAESGNYNGLQQVITIEVEKATPTIDFTQATSRVYTYNGKTQTIDGITHNNTDADAILEVTGNTFQDVPANGGRLPVTATLKETANYHAASLTMNITINKATFDMSQYSFSGDVIRYGEKIINGSAKGIPDGMEVAYKLNGVDVQDPENELKFKNAGTYVVEAIYNFSRNNYYLPNELVSSITIVINKVDISVTVVSKSGYYGDRPQYAVEDDVTIYGKTEYDDELDVTIELEERDVYPVGTYQVTAKATANDNYKLTVISGTYTIVERNITIVADNKEVEYGVNVPLTYSIYYGHYAPGEEYDEETAGLIKGDQLVGRLDRVPGTTVGEYAITGEFTNSNYNIEIQDGVYKIIPKNITIVVYDQEGVSASDVNPGAYKVVGGMVRGDDLKIKVSGEVGSEPGTYVLTATYDVENKNYNVNIQEGSFILRLLAQINVNNASLQKLYDGTPYVLDAVATSGAPITYRLNGVDVENSFTEVGLYEVLLTAPVHGDYAAPTPLRITIEIRPQTLSTEVDGMHFIISTPEGFGALDEFRVVKTEDLVLSNDAYTSQINTAYVMYIVVDGVETPVEQYLDGKESKVKVKLTNELVEQGAGAWLTDQNVNALNTSNTLDEDGYIELNAIGGSHILLVTERASAVPIIIILSVIGVVAVILFFMFLFRKKYIN